jgi:hypothetical protein
MKKLLLAIVLFPIICFSQLNVDNQWGNAVNTTFDSLEKNRISSEILLDYAIEFTDVTAYNGILTDSTTIDRNSSDTY